MNYNYLLLNIDKAFLSNPILENEKLANLYKLIQDNSFISFLKTCNGGFFFNRSIQIYSLSELPDYNSISKMNEVIKREYKDIVKNEIFFAQDVFGNQFGFSEIGIVFFNIETGKKERIARDFDDWTEKIKADLDYYSGKNLVLSLLDQNIFLDFNQRLCPKKPFVIGGEYKIDNLYPLIFPQYIILNADIAKQIYSIPDGTPVRLKIID